MLMKKFKVSEDVLAAVISYIQSKPFNEVNQIMTILQNDLQLIGEEEVERPLPENKEEDKDKKEEKKKAKTKKKES